MSDSGNAQAFTRQALGQVIARRVAFNIGSQRDHDFFNPFRGDPLLQLDNPQVIGFNSVQRRDFATQNVVLAAIGAGLFHAQDVDRPFDHANKGGVPSRVVADVTGRFFRESTAELAQADMFTRLQDGLSQKLYSVRIGLNEVKGNPFSGSGTDARQFAQGADQAGDMLGKDSQGSGLGEGDGGH